jgi:hypothetical protein
LSALSYWVSSRPSSSLLINSMRAVTARADGA